MASLGQTFNNNDSERRITSGGGGPVPSGVYVVTLVKTENNDTSTGGKILQLEYDIQEPEEYANRKVWDQINYVNAKEITQRIAHEQLEDLRMACGIDELHDDEQLMDNTVLALVEVELAKPYKDKRTGETKEGKDRNVIKKYWHIQTTEEEVNAALAKRNERKKEDSTPKEAASAPKTAATSSKPAATATTGSKSPWNKHKPA